jgi:hypothetical protein
MASIINGVGRRIDLGQKTGLETFCVASHLFSATDAVKKDRERADLAVNDKNVIYDFGKESTFVHYGTKGRVHSASFGLGEPSNLERMREWLAGHDDLAPHLKAIRDAKSIMVGEDFVIINEM